MHLPTLRQLQFLDALAAEGSFSRAAKACHVTQPTLSAAIKELETLLGVQLVERSARGAALTRIGEDVAGRAQRVLSETQDLVLSARDAGEPLSGGFRLGAIPTIAPYALPGILPQLRRTYPGLKLYLREDKTDRLIDALRARQLDAALIALPWTSAGIETEDLLPDEFLLVTPLGHSLAGRKNLSADDLPRSELLLLEDGHCLRDHALEACTIPAPPRGTEVSATSLQTLIQMVAGGLGISLVPRLAVDDGLLTGVDVAVTPFSPPLKGRSIGLAWRAGSARIEEARLIGDALKSVL
ncbi:MAG: hydrogen peroxide-inducible genes activator [Pseudomonadota bacterium]